MSAAVVTPRSVEPVVAAAPALALEPSTAPDAVAVDTPSATTEPATATDKIYSTTTEAPVEATTEAKEATTTVETAAAAPAASSTKPVKRSPFAELKNFLRSPKGSPTTETPPALEQKKNEEAETPVAPATVEETPKEAPTTEAPADTVVAGDATEAGPAAKDVKRPRSPPFLEKLKHVFSSDKKEKKEKALKSDKETSSDEETVAKDKSEPVKADEQPAPAVAARYESVEPTTEATVPAEPLSTTPELHSTGTSAAEPSTEAAATSEAVKFDEKTAAAKEDKPKKDSNKLGRRLSAKVTGFFASSPSKKDKSTTAAPATGTVADADKPEPSDEPPKIDTSIDESKVVPEVKVDEPVEAPAAAIEEPAAAAQEVEAANDVAPVATEITPAAPVESTSSAAK
ncbi:hypothetical protein OIO90_000537 [Microbotryomycetes sp. JL221]|nr:hypothetical protein OIO90_000537 [Microbotryomycetes sp. JL221]